jgi:hypothetical protein
MEFTHKIYIGSGAHYLNENDPYPESETLRQLQKEWEARKRELPLSMLDRGELQQIGGYCMPERHKEIQALPSWVWKP